MIRGLQVGFGAPIGHELHALAELGVDSVRVDLTQAQVPEADLVAEFDQAPVWPLFIIRPEQIELVPDGCEAELMNEPDLKGWTPERYAGMAATVLRRAAVKGVTLWCGCISNTYSRKQQWLAAMLRAVPEITHVSIHRYPPKANNAHFGHDGFRNRDDETQALMRVIGDRPYIVSEFGYHTAKFRYGWWWWQKRRLSDADVAEYVAHDWGYWERWGADAAYLYQINDGPGDSAGDRYGIRYNTRGGGWKPVAQTFMIGR